MQITVNVSEEFSCPQAFAEFAAAVSRLFGANAAVKPAAKTPRPVAPLEFVAPVQAPRAVAVEQATAVLPETQMDSADAASAFAPIDPPPAVPDFATAAQSPQLADPASLSLKSALAALAPKSGRGRPKKEKVVAETAAPLAQAPAALQASQPGGEVSENELKALIGSAWDTHPIQVVDAEYSRILVALKAPGSVRVPQVRDLNAEQRKVFAAEFRAFLARDPAVPPQPTPAVPHPATLPAASAPQGRVALY